MIGCIYADGGESVHLRILPSSRAKQLLKAASQIRVHRHSVRDFSEYLSFPENASAQKLSELRTGRSILEERLTREREVSDRTAERKKAAKEAEENRNRLAMLRYKEDRLNRKEKDERERLARAAKAAAKAKADADAANSSTTHPQSPMSPTGLPGKPNKQD